VPAIDERMDMERWKTLTGENMGYEWAQSQCHFIYPKSHKDWPVIEPRPQ